MREKSSNRLAAYPSDALLKALPAHVSRSGEWRKVVCRRSGRKGKSSGRQSFKKSNWGQSELCCIGIRQIPRTQQGPKVAAQDDVYVGCASVNKRLRLPGKLSYWPVHSIIQFKSALHGFNHVHTL
jgi:hypothetical protein